MDKKASFFSRFMAYVMDLFIVTIIVGVITMGFGTNTITKLNEEASNLVDSYLDGEVSDMEYISDYIGIFYDLNEASFNSNLVYLVICIGYFLIF